MQPESPALVRQGPCRCCTPTVLHGCRGGAGSTGLFKGQRPPGKVRPEDEPGADWGPAAPELM